MITSLTIKTYLKSRIAFDVPDSVLDSICAYREVDVDAEVYSISVERQELCYADLLSWAATTPSSITGAKDSDGGWKHEEESKTLSITDKKDMRTEANAIYKAYGDSRYKKNSGSMKFIDI